MIKTVADLLESLLAKEAPILAKFSASVKHPTIIGNMYEGLTKDLLEQSVFDGLDLRVVDGKILNRTGELSGQIDCMIVCGDGVPIPYTTSFIYPVENVIAVFEVKKNLYSADLKEAHENLLTVGGSHQPSHYKFSRSAFWHVTGADIPGDSPEMLTPSKQVIFACLDRDVCSPLRIIFGYFGFKSESSLQSHLIDYLESNHGKKGFGPASLPNLIVCQECAVVKTNGMPFSVTLKGSLPGIAEFRPEEWWPLYASKRGISVLLLLEILWTRLRQRFVIPATIFGQDLDVEGLNCFLFAKPHAGQGWEYYFHEVSETTLAESPVSRSWRPEILERPEFVVFTRLAGGEEVKLSDPDLNAFLEGEGRTSVDFVDRMQATRIIYVEPESGRLILLAESVVLGISPKGEYFVDRGDSPRSINWSLSNFENSSD